MLTIENLSFAYQKKGPMVLDNLSLTLPDGKVGILLGPNGSGKSTLFKILVGIQRPFAGKMTLNGVDLVSLKRMERAKRIAYVPQTITFGDLSVYDSVLAGRLCRFGFYPGKEDEAIVRTLLEEMGLTPLALRNVSSLSGGERQKVAIARALAQEPELLIFDEPTGNLDINNEQLVLKEARSIADKKGISILLSIHDLSLASAFGDVFYLLEGASIRYAGDNDVLSEKNLSDLYGIPVSVEVVHQRKFIYIGEEENEKK